MEAHVRDRYRVELVDKPPSCGHHEPCRDSATDHSQPLQGFKGEQQMFGPVNLPPYSVVQTIQGQQAAADALKAQQDAEAQRAADMRAMMGALAVRNASTSQGR